MNTVVYGYRVNGTAEEILYLLRLMQDKRNKDRAIQRELEELRSRDKLVPMEEIVEESKSLRQKLSEDPSYNPFPGVVASKEPNMPEEDRPFLEEMDTGIHYED